MLPLDPPLQPLHPAGAGMQGPGALCHHFPVPTPTFDTLWAALEREAGGNLSEFPVLRLLFPPRVSCLASVEGVDPGTRLQGLS